MPKHTTPEGSSSKEDTVGNDQAQHVGEVAAKAAANVEERHEKLTEDVDAILDEIDDVLESNAEDFVRAFVQKGGQ